MCNTRVCPTHRHQDSIILTSSCKRFNARLKWQCICWSISKKRHHKKCTAWRNLQLSCGPRGRMSTSNAECSWQVSLHPSWTIAQMTHTTNCYPRRKKSGSQRVDLQGKQVFGHRPIGDQDHNQELHAHSHFSQAGFPAATSPFMAKAREKARAKAVAAPAFDEARTLRSPTQGLGNTQTGNLAEALDRNLQSAPTCPFLGPRQQIAAWERLGSDQVLLQVLRKGIDAPLRMVPQPKPSITYHDHDQNSLQATIGEYLQAGVLRILTKDEEQRTRF